MMIKHLLHILKLETSFHCTHFIQKLTENRIFYQWNKKKNNNYSDSWFKHELIQRCLEDSLSVAINSEYHDKAAKFFVNLQKNLERKIDRSRTIFDNIAVNKNGNLKTHNEYEISHFICISSPYVRNVS